MIWGPFALALVLGLVVSAGLYLAYLWPHVEPSDEATVTPPAPVAPEPPVVPPQVAPEPAPPPVLPTAPPEDAA